MQHLYVFITLAIALVLFVWGRIRHDFVALIALFVLVAMRIVPPAEAFAGFGHPAVITVAAVLLIGKALEHSGLIDVVGKWISRFDYGLSLQILILSLLVALSSAFINNVGALAIVMPVALNMAKKHGNPPSSMLMPVAFASLLGGMVTLIGTPPNIIIATLRAGETGEAFGMFAFAPVGAGLILVGILFISLVGWRLLPIRKTARSESESFNIDDYITEVKVGKGSKIPGLTIGELKCLSKADIQILGLVRNNKRIHAPDEEEELIANDIIIIECDTDALKAFVDDTGLELAGGKKFRKDAVGSKNIAINEAVVMADSSLIGQTTSGLRMRSRYGVNLLAVSRRGKRIHRRLDHVTFTTGDVLMLQGRAHMLNDSITSMGCLPLVQRGVRIGYEKKIALSLVLFVASIVMVIAGLLPVHIAFPMAAVGMVLTGVLPVKDLYLMAIAVGSSAAFLTPIGHQSNILVMGPGGYQFEDYLRLGSIVSALIIAAAVPLILYFWPVFQHCCP